MVDYRKFGRQIALPEVTVEGQRRIALADVRFVGSDDAVQFATTIWHRAGGGASVETANTGTSTPPTPPPARDPERRAEVSVAEVPPAPNAPAHSDDGEWQSAWRAASVATLSAWAATQAAIVALGHQHHPRPPPADLLARCVPPPPDPPSNPP